MMEDIQSILQQKCRIDRNKPVLIGVSGGPDSLFLLYICHDFQLPILLAHFNHHLRPEAGEEALRVRYMAQQLGVEAIFGEADVSELAGSEHLSLEEAARNARYRFLFSQAETKGVQAVAVAHTADDQIETVLMHLLRGAGVSGLRGMPYYSLPNPWSATIPLVRPLLGTWRTEIDADLQARGLEPIQDASNQDKQFYRNRIRLELVPLLKQLKPDAPQSILRMTRVLQSEDEVLDDLVDSAWEACKVQAAPGYVSFGREGFLHQPLALQRRLIRRMISILRTGLRDIDFETVERAIETIKQPPATGQANLAAGLTLFFEGSQVYLAEAETALPASDWPQLPEGEIYEISAPSQKEFPGGWVLKAEIVDLNPDLEEQIRRNNDPYQAWFDLGNLAWPLRVRTVCLGDRFTPLGMGGAKVHLAEWMVNHKIPRRARSAWPLFVSGSEILWVPGYRSSDTYKINESTSTALFLSLHKINSQ